MPANRTASLVAREGLGGPYVLLTFLHPETAREARPGQFVMIKAGVSAEPPLRRPFSILETSPERETFTLFIKLIGQGSKALASLPIGGFAQCLGPLGRTGASGTRGLVRKRGLEPPLPCGNKLLRLARLPVPPLPHEGCLVTGRNCEL